ncbi:MAG: hypothetical protein HZB68_03425 [Candidatus Aenigmarchaeota archaeon]|nr:hypothetical protein [Candidatus Aenigmarchaeota archaeon]
MEQQICPKCKSRNVTHDTSRHAYGKGTLFNSMQCKDCGNSGIFFPAIKKG